MARWRPVLVPAVLSILLGFFVGLLGLVAVYGSLAPSARQAANTQAGNTQAGNTQAGNADNAAR